MGHGLRSCCVSHITITIFHHIHGHLAFSFEQEYNVLYYYTTTVSLMTVLTGR
jgi:hypothetical protein